MRIAILGATSQIAKDLIFSFITRSGHDLVLFARRPEVVNQWASLIGFNRPFTSLSFSEFSLSSHYDAILNFVGVGDPAKAAAMGAGIFEVTLSYDSMVLEYLKEHPECRYLFLSSGAAYGSFQKSPISQNSIAAIPVNDIQPQDWYGVAKLHAECRHRAAEGLSIFDIRVFNYFSHTQNLSARFFITDMLRAVAERVVFRTSPDFMMRDYLHPEDFYSLVTVLLDAKPTNAPIDCYTRAPVDKFTLLEMMKNEFGLRYEVIDGSSALNSTGAKPFYFSLNRQAKEYGYRPVYTSIEGVLKESAKLLTAIKGERTP